MAETVAADGSHGDGFGAKGTNRFMFGYHRRSGTCMHRLAWAQLAAQETADRILTSIWQSDSFVCYNGVGDFSLPGSEYQALHLDASGAYKVERDSASGAVTDILAVDALEATVGKVYTRTNGFHDPAGAVKLEDLPTFEVTV
eukprot:COSAG06_NODE_38188_length_426_cov_0.792049_1_plen_142_part_11